MSDLRVGGAVKCKSGKIRYKSGLNAERALAKALLSNWAGKAPHRREQRTYECPWCGGWHLTSKPKRRGI